MTVPSEAVVLSEAEEDREREYLLVYRLRGDDIGWMARQMTKRDREIHGLVIRVLEAEKRIAELEARDA